MRPPGEGLWHPWLRLERAIRVVLAERLERGSSTNRDQALAMLITKQDELARDGWFN